MGLRILQCLPGLQNICMAAWYLLKILALMIYHNACFVQEPMADVQVRKSPFVNGGRLVLSSECLKKEYERVCVLHGTV